MVIDQINIGHVVGIEAENDSPVGAHRDTPKPFQITSEQVQAEAGQIHIVRSCRPLQSSEDDTNFLDMFSVYPASIVILVKVFQTSVPNMLNHAYSK